MLYPSKTLFIGVDGGGTGCRVAIGTEAGDILGQAQGGRANLTTDAALATRNVVAAIDAAAQSANIPTAALSNAVVHIGIAGVMTPADGAKFAATLPYDRITVTDDRLTTVTGALGNRNGYVMSVGTGTITAGQMNGTVSYCGGWGFRVSDHGSGAWLGRAALEQVLLCHDGLAEHTPLTRNILAQYDYDPNAIVAFSMAAQPGDFATHAPDIIAGADKADPWGQSIMQLGTDFLMRALVSLGFRSGDPLCMMGGVGPHYARYLPTAFQSGRIEAAGSALDGALALARSRHSQPFGPD